MALKQSYRSRYGTEHSESYHKVNKVELLVGELIHAQLGVYASEDASTAGSSSLGEFKFFFPYTSSVDENFVSQSYSYIKKLDEYTGSLDV
jgi:hypothetical protein